MNEFHDEYDTAIDSKYYLKGENIGVTVNPGTANQIGELGKVLNQGMQNVEIGPVDPRIFDTIPQEHFQEMNRLAKVTGANVSVHAPMIDIIGFTQQGWDEAHRLSAEKQIESVIERSHEIDPKGNTPITIHGGTMGAYEWQKETEEKWKKKMEEEQGGRDFKKGFPEARVMSVVNQETGQVSATKFEEKYYPSIKGGKEKIPVFASEFLEQLNQNEWDKNKLQLLEIKKNMQEMENIHRPDRIEFNLLNEKKQTLGVLSPEEETKYQEAKSNIENFSQYKHEYYQNARILLKEMHNSFMKHEPEIREKIEKEKIDEYRDTLKQISKEQQKLQEMEKKGLTQENYREYSEERMKFFNDSTNNLINSIMHIPAPEVWKPMDEFSIEKASKTLGEAAAHAYKKFGKTTPLICLENVYPEMPLSRAESVKQTIEQARKEFVKKVTEEQNISKQEAKKAAEKIIGATWDIGHINMLRKAGFTEEDIIKETKKIMPFVKHAHITDNFGYSDSHLPPGMGNVPIKKFREELEKQGYSGRAIMEIGGWAQHFPTEGAYLPVLTGIESPLYKMEAPPYWTETAHRAGSYYVGMGEIYPQQHHEMYGSSFTTLPKELGGQAPSDKSRFSGTPTE